MAPKIARASDRAARIIARERTRAEGRQVSVQENSFTGRAPLEPGNLAIVQLLSDVPWVYNELGALTGGNTTKRMTLAARTAMPGPARRGRGGRPDRGRLRRPTSTATLRACLAGAPLNSPGRISDRADPVRLPRTGQQVLPRPRTSGSFETVRSGVKLE